MLLAACLRGCDVAVHDSDSMSCTELRPARIVKHCQDATRRTVTRQCTPMKKRHPAFLLELAGADTRIAGRLAQTPLAWHFPSNDFFVFRFFCNARGEMFKLRGVHVQRIASTLRAAAVHCCTKIGHEWPTPLPRAPAA